MKKIVIVNSTLRKGGNSEILANKFEEGAKAAGHSVTLYNIRDLDLKFCIGCLSCGSTHKCVIKDSMNDLYETFQNADIVVFASPVYYYSVCGQLKTFLDRLNPLYSRNNKFKEVYLLSTSAEADNDAMEGSISDIQGWIDCFAGVRLKGVLRAIGVNDKGEVISTNFPQMAFEMGKNIK